LRVLEDFKTTMLLPWTNAFSLPNPATFGSLALLLVAVFSLLTLAYLLLFSFFQLRKQRQEQTRFPLSAILLALAAFLLAGIPFWITDLPVNLVFPYDRFTIPTMLAFSLFWVALLFALPLHANLRRGVLVILLVFSTAYQLQTGIRYQRDWEQQSRLFWQLLWRAPSIQPGTILFAHELPLTYFSDGTLTSALNWIYDPQGDLSVEPQDESPAISYAFYYPTLRLGNTIESLQPGQAIRHDLLVGTFAGNTSQSLSLFYQPPACLRILDPEIEAGNWMVPLQVRETVALSNTDNILPAPQSAAPAFLYGAEPEHGWCYYYEKADLARQMGDWETVLSLAKTAFTLDDQPNDPAERLPFIEAYAHNAEWEQAIRQTSAAAQVSPVIHPVLCRLWERIERETEPGPEQQESIQTIREQLLCSPQP
jgi:hypothetical protein